MHKTCHSQRQGWWDGLLLGSMMWLSWAIHLPADPSGPSLLPSLFFILVGSLTFFSLSLSGVRKTFSPLSLFLYLCFCLLAVSCRLTDFRWPCCIDQVRKKASGKTRCRPCNASAVTSVVTSSFSSSHLHMVTFPDSQELQSLLLWL